MPLICPPAPVFIKLNVKLCYQTLTNTATYEKKLCYKADHWGNYEL